MVKINWTLNAQVEGGPTVSASQVVEVGAYEVISVDLEPGEKADVDVANDIKKVKLLLIKLMEKEYPPKLTWKTGAKGAGTFELEAPIILAGSGAVGLLDTVKTLTFTNDAKNPKVTLQILVGRDTK